MGGGIDKKAGCPAVIGRQRGRRECEKKGGNGEKASAGSRTQGGG